VWQARLAFPIIDINFSRGLMSITRLATISDLSSQCVPGDRIYLDLDDTLIFSEPDASTRFEEAMKSAFEAQGVNTNDIARAATCELWTGMQSSCEVHAVEGTATVASLKILRDRGHELIGLTARSPELVKETLQHLKSCLLSDFFEDSSLGILAQPEEGDCRGPLIHERGVIYCTGSRKLQAVVAYERARPSGEARLVFVDDLMKHLEAVRNGLVPLGRKFLGLHYTAFAEQAYEMPRLGTLLAGMMANSKGRAHIAKALELIDAAEKENARL